jgi:hypothetical protein
MPATTPETLPRVDFDDLAQPARTHAVMRKSCSEDRLQGKRWKSSNFLLIYHYPYCRALEPALAHQVKKARPQHPVQASPDAIPGFKHPEAHLLMTLQAVDALVARYEKPSGFTPAAAEAFHLPR